MAIFSPLFTAHREKMLIPRLCQIICMLKEYKNKMAAIIELGLLSL